MLLSYLKKCATLCSCRALQGVWNCSCTLCTAMTQPWPSIWYGLDIVFAPFFAHQLLPFCCCTRTPWASTRSSLHCDGSPRSFQGTCHCPQCYDLWTVLCGYSIVCRMCFETCVLPCINLFREFILPDTIRLWDSLLADPDRFDFLLYLCTAMLMYVLIVSVCADVECAAFWIHYLRVIECPHLWVPSFVAIQLAERTAVEWGLRILHENATGDDWPPLPAL